MRSNCLHRRWIVCAETAAQGYGGATVSIARRLYRYFAKGPEGARVTVAMSRSPTMLAQNVRVKASA